MARIIVIGGIESTYRNAQVLHELGEDIVMFYTRGAASPGWEGVALIDDSQYSFASQVPTTVVDDNINNHVEAMAALKPDVIYSLGWQQVYKPDLLNLCPVVGIHESLLPKGAGAVPLANAILDDLPQTGCTLFWLDGGMDTGDIIGQLVMPHSPQTATATALYNDAMLLGEHLLRMFVPRINDGTVPRIPQDMAQRTTYGKVFWDKLDAIDPVMKERLARARTYPYA